MGAISRRTATTTPKKKKTKTMTLTVNPEEETVNISQKRLKELLALPEQIKKLKIRVTNAERSLKRKITGGHKDDSAKRTKVLVGNQPLIDFLRETPRLVNPAYFHNWWHKKGVFTLTKKRMMGEMTNMGLDPESLVNISLHFLSEVYCLIVSLLSESSDVPN